MTEKRKNQIKKSTKIGKRNKKKSKSMSKKNVNSLILKKNQLIAKILVTPRSTKQEHLKNVIKKFNEFIISYNKKYNEGNYLVIKDVNILESLNPNIFFCCVQTIPYINHPFIIYGFLKQNYFKVLFPIGNKPGQVNFEIIKKN